MFHPISIYFYTLSFSCFFIITATFFRIEGAAFLGFLSPISSCFPGINKYVRNPNRRWGGYPHCGMVRVYCGSTCRGNAVENAHNHVCVCVTINASSPHKLLGPKIDSSTAKSKLDALWITYMCRGRGIGVFFSYLGIISKL